MCFGHSFIPEGALHKHVQGSRGLSLEEESSNSGGESKEEPGGDSGSRAGCENFVSVTLEDGDLLGLSGEDLLNARGDESTSWLCGPTETTDVVAGDGPEEQTSGSVLGVVETEERDTVVWGEALNGAAEVRVGEGTKNSLTVAAGKGLTAEVQVGGRDTTVEDTEDGAGGVGDEAECVVRVKRIRSRKTSLDPRVSTALPVTVVELSSEARVVVQNAQIEGTVEAVPVVKRITSNVPVSGGSDTYNVALDPTSLREDTVDTVSSNAGVQNTANTTVAIVSPSPIPVGISIGNGTEGQHGQQDSLHL